MFEETRSLIKEHGGLIAAAFLLVFFSAFGQSVFFGAYIPHFQEEIGLSKTALGSIYAIATIASSLVIVFTGKALDRFPLRHFLAFVMAGVAVGCFVLADAHTALSLFLAFFLLRQFGQGLMVLSATTSVNRYLSKGRGKAVALVSLGGSAHLMIFPPMALYLEQYIGWREAWTYYGWFILLVLLPAFWFYLKSHQRTTHANWESRMKAEAEQTVNALENEWTRKHVLKDWRFYALISIAIIPPFVGTVIFFYQRELAESLSLTPLAFAGTFPLFTAASVFCSLSAGHLIDKYGEKPVLIAFPILFSIGLALLTSGAGLIFALAGMMFIGGANGMMNTTGGPLLAHLYGTKHLGSIKSLLFSTNILASALSPFTFGFLMDRGYDITTQLSWIIFYSGVIWLLAFPVCKNIKKERTHDHT